MQKKKKINLPVVMGSIIIIFFVVIALLAPYIAPYDPAATSSLTYAKPSAEHWLGTNDVGQDIFSELLYGTRISMGIGVLLHLLLPFWERFWRCFPGGMEDMWIRLLLP